MRWGFRGLGVWGDTLSETIRARARHAHALPDANAADVCGAKGLGSPSQRCLYIQTNPGDGASIGSRDVDQIADATRYAR